MTTKQVKNAIVIYHANCTDGFGSAWAFKRLVEPEWDHVDYLPAVYGEGIKNEYELKADYDVFILDFSFPRDELKRICAHANTVTVLDHHKTAQEALTGWDDAPNNLKIEFDMNRSGAGMTWDYFTEDLDPEFKGPPRPALINYIEIGDLWKFDKLSHGKEITTYIKSVPFTFEAFDVLNEKMNTDIPTVIEMGALLQRYEAELCAKIVDLCARPILIEGKKGLVANCPWKFASEVGNLLSALSGTFGATYYHNKDDEVCFSLRSRGDYDVSAIAKSFGGGGHRNAAGFVIKSPSPVDDRGVTIWGLTAKQTLGG